MPQLQANFHRSHPVWPLVARRYRLLGVGMHLDHDRVAALARGLADEAPPFLLTVLREPRARLLSRYKEWRSTPDDHMQAARDHVKEAILTARTKSFSEFLHSDNPVIVDQLRNLQARLLAGLNFSLKASDDEILERARFNLAAYDLIGMTPCCDETMDLLGDAYGWSRSTAGVPRVHVSQPLPSTGLCDSAADEARIAALTALDQALWDDVTGDSVATPSASDRRPASPSLRDEHAPAATGHPVAAAANDRSPPTVDLGPGYATVHSILAACSPEHVIGLGRRRWFPPPEAHPPLLPDDSVVFVVRAQAFSHWRSYVLERASIPSASVLAMTEVDDHDPRLRAVLRAPHVHPYAALHGRGNNAVATLAVGRLRHERGISSLDATVEVLERLHDTRPVAVRSLHDSPATRGLVTLELQLLLHAATDVLQGNSQAQVDRWLLATLHPEDHDPLLPRVAQPLEPLAALWERLRGLLDREPQAPAPDLVAAVHDAAQRLFPAAGDAAPLDAQPFEAFTDLAAAVLALLAGLQTPTAVD